MINLADLPCWPDTPEWSAQVFSNTWTATEVILGCLVPLQVARKCSCPLSMSCTSRLALTTHSALMILSISILVPGDPEFVVWSSAQEDKSHTKSGGHSGSVNLLNYLDCTRLNVFTVMIWTDSIATMSCMFCRIPEVVERQRRQSRRETKRHTLTVQSCSGNDDNSTSDSWNVLVLFCQYNNRASSDQ